MQARAIQVYSTQQQWQVQMQRAQLGSGTRGALTVPRQPQHREAPEQKGRRMLRQKQLQKQQLQSPR
jgi:hypothetical protein